MIENRKRHYEDMLLKKNHQLQVSLAETLQREENQKRRQKAQSTIQVRRYEAMIANKASKLDVQAEVEIARQ